MKLERRPECENRTSEGGPIFLIGDLHVNHNHFGQFEQMDIGLMGFRAGGCKQKQQPQCPNPPRLYSIPVHDDNQNYPNLCKLVDNLSFYLFLFIFIFDFYCLLIF